MRLRDLRIRTRILLIAASVFSFLVLVGVVFYVNVKRVEGTNREVQLSQETIGRVRQVGWLVAEMEDDLRGYLLSNNPALVSRYRLRRTEVDGALAETKRLMGGDPAQSEILNRVSALLDNWVGQFAEPSIEAKGTGGDVSSLVRGERSQHFLEDVHRELDSLIQAEQSRLADREQRASESMSSAAWRTVLSTLIGVVIAISLVLLVSRQIANALNNLGEAMNEVEAGNLSARAEAQSQDELGKLSLRFNAMIARLEAASEELHRRDIQAAVLAVARALSSGERAVMLRAGLEEILRVTDCPTGVIYLCEKQEQQLIPAAVAGASQDVRERSYAMGDDLVGRAAETREPLYVRASVQKAPLTVNHWGGSFVPAEVAYLPLVHQQELVGVLGLARLEFFDDLARNALQIIAGQLAIAILNTQNLELAREQAVANALLFEEQRQAAERAEELLNVSRDISTLKLDEILGSLTIRTRRLLKSDLAAVATLTESGTTKWAAASGMRTDAYQHIESKPGQGTAGRAIAARQTVTFQGIGENPDLPAEEFPIHVAEGVDSAAGAPLMIRGRAFGALIIGYRSSHDFTDDEIRLLEGLADQAAVAIDNAQQYERIEQQNKELAEATRLKSQFLANMSHELRTPMAIIMGFTKTVLRGMQGPISDEQRESLQMVYDNAQNLLQLINDVLDLSKIEAGRMEIRPEQFSPRELLQATESSFATLARNKGLKLRVEIAPDAPPFVNNDRARVQQILNNLVSNAIKFTERGGRIDLRAQGEANGRWRLEVEDTGIGIAQEDVPRVFEEFRQLDGSTTRKAGGTGLGLSIVKRLVNLLDGELEVQSQPGVGTTFSVTLPVEGGIVPELKNDQAVSTEGRHFRGDATVLAVDDDPAFLRLLSLNLRESGYKVLTARNGAEGLRLAAEAKPYAVILDVKMPDIDGWRMLRELKANPQTAGLPVIMVSVIDERGLGFALGASDYLVKPIDRDQLLSALLRLRVNGHKHEPVLVVDDDAAVCNLLKSELSQEGFRVETAANGAEALEKVESQLPAAIILDLMMPVMDGFEVINRLKSDLRTSSIPVIVLTAKDLTDEDVSSINGHIEKLIQKGGKQAEALISELVRTLDTLDVAHYA